MKPPLDDFGQGCLCRLVKIEPAVQFFQQLVGNDFRDAPYRIRREFRTTHQRFMPLRPLFSLVDNVVEGLFPDLGALVSQQVGDCFGVAGLDDSVGYGG